MKNLNLNEYGVKELTDSEVTKIDGGGAVTLFIAGLVAGALFYDLIWEPAKPSVKKIFKELIDEPVQDRAYSIGYPCA